MRADNLKRYSSTSSAGFGHLTLHIARKDWAESWVLIAALTGGLLVPALLVHFAPERSEDFSKGLLAGLLAGGGFGYAQYCFLHERERGTLETLLQLPVEVRQLLLAKYLSVFSMTLFTVNVPALLVPDPMLIFIVNAAALFLATLFMAATIVSEKPWAAQAPIWLLLIFVLPVQRLLTRYYPDGLAVLEALASSPFVLAVLALISIPVLVVVSSRVFVARLHR